MTPISVYSTIFSKPGVNVDFTKKSVNIFLERSVACRLPLENDVSELIQTGLNYKKRIVWQLFLPLTKYREHELKLGWTTK